MANDDWRIKVTFEDDEHGPHLVQSLEELELESDVHKRLGKRVTITHDASHIFLYCDSEQSLRASEQIVNSILKRRALKATVEPGRWHPIAESWEDPSVPLPANATTKESEHEQLEEHESEESAEEAFAEWEVVFEFDHHHEAVEFSERLETEGLRFSRRWRYVFVGMENEDAADQFAQRFKRELPDTVNIKVSMSPGALRQSMPGNPFSFFGGMGG